LNANRPDAGQFPLAAGVATVKLPEGVVMGIVTG
jgi:hypothetical protein